MKTMCAILLLVLAWSLAHAAAPQLQVPYGQLRPLPAMPNFLLNLSLTFEDAGAAYRDDYASDAEYLGYFNPRLCYRYPNAPSTTPAQPDLDARTGYFSPYKTADQHHACGGDGFSGNLLNWASTATLDLLRYGFTGGDRIIDEPGLTVLQRAWLPDGSVHADFYANAQHFPRKQVSGAAATTPFGRDTLFIVSCRNRILFSGTNRGHSCDAPRFGGGGRRLVSDKYEGEYNASVSVCDALDAASRPDLCHPYGRNFKPEGSLQAAAGSVRMGLMSYLTESGAGDRALYGGVLRVALGSIGGDTDPATGVGSESGVIAVINRIGRSNPARRGAYKAGDPGAEIYYEALRYLQGRAPTFAFAASSDDGLPIASRAQDPVLSGCQRNVIATVGHPSFTDDRQLPGNTRALRGDTPRAIDAFAATAFDVMAATRAVGALEANPANPAPRPDLLRLDSLDAGAGSFYLAGAALWAHTHAVRRDKPVRVDSYGLELGTADVPASSVLYLAAKYGGGGEGSAAWLAPGSEPVHFYPAPSPERVVGGARSLLSGAGANLGGPGPSAAWYAGATGFVIQTGAAPGTVQRHALRLQPDGGTSIAAEASWDGARLLAARSPASRKLYTFSGRATLPLTWDRLPPSMRSVLNAGALGEARIAYLRGERLRELGQPNGVFRVRDGVLGDIVHSVPLIAGRAQLAVYVGANDGMLHAFSADDGRELFAYLPGATLGAIADLSNPANPARATVDGSAAVGEVALGGRTPTILAAGMGMGARGVFALDVSDPAAFGEGVGALWEFTEHDDPGMGFLSAPPQIVSIDVSTRGGAPSPRHFVLVPSAVNHLNVDANGALYMLAVDKPAAQPWQIGANYYRIGTDGADPAQANALSTPGLVRDADGKAILAYAGDLQGSLWRFDLRSRRARRIFIARDNAGRAQPIAQAPAVVYAPGGGYLVLFGTGKFIEQGDVAPTSFLPQSMYAVVDRPGENAEPVTRAQLAQRVLSGSDGYSTTGRQVSYVGPGAQQGWYLDFPNTARDGERLGGGPIARGGAVLFQTMMPSVDACAPAASRQYVLDALSGFALAADGKVQPEAITAARAVAPTLIASQLIEIGMESGPRDATGGARVTRSFALIPAALAGATPSHDTLGSSTPIRVSFPAKRLGWREVANWQELHDAAGP